MILLRVVKQKQRFLGWERYFYPRLFFSRLLSLMIHGQKQLSQYC